MYNTQTRKQTMPVVKQVTLYSFDELSEQAQQKAIETVRGWDHLFEPDEEFVLEDIVAQNPHIKSMDISYSGFWSQGDGASFTGSIDGDWLIDFFAENVNDELKTILREVEVSFFRHSSRYAHWNTVASELDSGDIVWADHIEENDNLRWNILFNYLDDMRQAIEEYRTDLCHDIYNALKQAYEQCHSDENITELIKANEYLFHSNGDFE
jgi:hypothetical protein